MQMTTPDSLLIPWPEAIDFDALPDEFGTMIYDRDVFALSPSTAMKAGEALAYIVDLLVDHGFAVEKNHDPDNRRTRIKATRTRIKPPEEMKRIPAE